MPSFTYQARTSQGQQVSGTLTARTKDDAVNELRKKNLVVLQLDASGATSKWYEVSFFKRKGGTSRSNLARKARVKANDLILFTRQLATMLTSGIPLLECLEILAEQVDNLGFRAVIEDLVASVRSGSDFSESLARHPRAFSNIYVNMVKAGEASGQLDEILTRLAEYLEAAAELRGKIKSAMTYPVVSLGLIMTISILLLVFVVPKFEMIFKSLKVELPLPTQILLATSLFMKNQWYVWLGALIGGTVGLKLYARTEVGRGHIDWLKLKAPVFGPLFRKVALSRFSRTFATLIESGVPILGALEIVAMTSGNKLIEDAVMDASESVRTGETLAEPLAKSWVFPPMVTRMIGIGERSGALEALLKKISDFYDQQVSQAVESLTALIEPIMIGVMGVFVGGMVLAIFLPIFKLIGSL